MVRDTSIAAASECFFRISATMSVHSTRSRQRLSWAASQPGDNCPAVTWEIHPGGTSVEREGSMDLDPGRVGVFELVVSAQSYGWSRPVAAAFVPTEVGVQSAPDVAPTAARVLQLQPTGVGALATLVLRVPGDIIGDQDAPDVIVPPLGIYVGRTPDAWLGGGAVHESFAYLGSLFGGPGGETPPSVPPSTCRINDGKHDNLLPGVRFALTANGLVFECTYGHRTQPIVPLA